MRDPLSFIQNNVLALILFFAMGAGCLVVPVGAAQAISLPALPGTGGTVGASSAATPVVAASPTVSSAAASSSPCDLTEPLDQLSTLKQETAAAPLTELKLRKDLLQATITCALVDLELTQTAVAGLTTYTTQDKAMRGAFAADLQAAHDYYVARANEFAALDSIEATQTAAQALNAWREQDYVAMLWEANEFVALMQNGALIRAANGRFIQIKDAMSSLNLEDNGEVRSLLKDADASIDVARGEQALALGSLRKTRRSAPEVVLDHSRLSLDALRTTYKTFFAISAVVRTLVP
jgi:hypothetical protein